ncbi:MAG: chromosomal replication initiator protein DnaA [Planctomycetes bacterium]|nr:chromosomal replication initiator protein DnaA [Planctomycetota bacterium]
MPTLDSAIPLPSGDEGPTRAASAGVLGAAELATHWEHILEVLRGSIRREQFETWFRRAAPVALDGARLTIAVHNAFAREWLLDYYKDELAAAAERALGSARTIEIVVDPERVASVAPARVELPVAALPATAPARAGAAPGLADAARADLGRIETPRTDLGRDEPGRLLGGSDVTLNPYNRFDNFVVGPCNRFAHAACVGVAEQPGKTYNPLFIHGSSGLGKTHLMQSLCHSVLAREPRTRILYLSCETFVNHFISALEHGNLTKFRDKYRNVGLLVVDDIHLLANKEKTQEEFFHTFNTLYNAGAQIVLSSDSPPVEIPTLQERLVSRFSWGLVTQLETPCYETRVAILKRKSRERGRELPDELARFLAERIETNVRELEGAVNKLLGFSSLSGQELSLQLARQCLRELFTLQRGQPSIDDILRAVTARYGVKLSDLQSRRRTNAIVVPRQVGMYLARRVTRMSLEEIGHYFGGRDHSTVLYAIGKVGRVSREDEEMRRNVTELLLELAGPDGS